MFTITQGTKDFNPETGGFGHDLDPRGGPSENGEVLVNVSSRITDAVVWIAQRERVRTMRVQRHLAVAFLAGLGCVFVTPFVATLLGLTLISMLVYVMLASLAKAMDAHRGFLWGWLYPEPKETTRFDRVIDRIVQRLVAAQVHHQAAAQADDPLPRVRPL